MRKKIYGSKRIRNHKTKECKKHLHYLNQLYNFLAQTNQAIIESLDEESLWDRICRIAVETGGIKMSWIGRPGEDDRFIVLSSYGSGTEYLKDIYISASSIVPEGKGPTGMAYRENRLILCQDFLEDNHTRPWQKRAFPYRWRASAAIPLRRGGQPYAVLTVYHHEPNIFDQRMINLLEEITSNISFALDQFAVNYKHRKAKERLFLFGKVGEQISEGVIITDVGANIIYVNEGFTQLTGYQEKEVIGRNPNLLSSGRQDEEFYKQMWQAIQDRGHWRGELWNRRKDGVEYAECLSINKIVDINGATTNYIGILRNINERIEAEKKLFEVQQRLIDIIDFLPEATFVIDHERKVIAWNKAIEMMTGVKAEDMLGKGDYEYSLPLYHQRRPVLIDLALDFKEEESKPYQFLHFTQGDVLVGESTTHVLPGGKTHFKSKASVIRDSQGVPIAAIETIRDITQHKEAKAKIQHLAYYDALTDLPNRTLLTERVNEAIAKAEISKEPLVLMFLDLDHFKNINDTLGHRIGDLLLQELSKRLKSLFADQEIVYRLSGDEFILLLPNTDMLEGASLAKKLLFVHSQPFYIEGHELTITPSIGIALYPQDGSDFETLYKCADIAMFFTKQEGRNSYRFYSPEMQLHSIRQLQMENALRKALERDELCLFYQPQISLTTGEVVGMEALIRWQHPEFGLVSPLEFIPLAEETGLILPIGEWVLREAINQAKSWQKQGFSPITVAVNLSAVQLRQEDLPTTVLQYLKEADLPPQYLELELTESAAMSNPQKAIAMLDAFHALGISIAIDDFGTGYSSLEYLTRFKINKLKIDQSFVQKIGTNSNAEVIIDMIIGMTQNLNLRTIAEGVETEEHLNFLRERGCRELQGYYYSKPKPAEDILRWLKVNNANGLKQ